MSVTCSIIFRTEGLPIIQQMRMWKYYRYCSARGKLWFQPVCRTSTSSFGMSASANKVECAYASANALRADADAQRTVLVQLSGRLPHGKLGLLHRRTHRLLLACHGAVARNAYLVSVRSCCIRNPEFVAGDQQRHDSTEQPTWSLN